MTRAASVRAPLAEPGAHLAAGARWILLGVALVGVALVVFSADRFRSVTEGRAWLWYIMGVAVAAGGVVTSRARPSVRIGFALAALVAILLVFAVELILEMEGRAHYTRIDSKVAAMTGRPFDHRDGEHVVKDLRAKGVDAVAGIVPRGLLQYMGPGSDPRSRFPLAALPLGGISMHPTVEGCNEDGTRPVYDTDEHGFENPRGLWDGNPVSVVTIGDSFTHGYCVQPENTIAGNLRRRWPRTLNLGSAGAGPLIDLATLTEYALPAHPSLVLWIWFGNDFEDLAEERTNEYLPKYLDSTYSQRLLTRQPELDSAMVPWMDLLYARNMAIRGAGEHGMLQLVTLHSLRKAVKEFLHPAPPFDIEAQIPMFREALSAAKHRADANGSKLAIVFLADWEHAFTVETEEQHRTIASALRVVRELGIDVVDTRETFLAAPNRDELFGRGHISNSHFSAKGYALTERTIETILDSLKLAPPSASRAPAGAPTHQR